MGKLYGFTFIRNSRVDSSKLLFLEKYCPCCLLTPHRFVSTIFCCYQDANTNHQSRFLRIKNKFIDLQIKFQIIPNFNYDKEEAKRFLVA